MSKQPQQVSYEDLNDQVHDLVYVDDKKVIAVEVKTNPRRGLELAEKIKQNIEAYRNENNLPAGPSLKTL